MNLYSCIVDKITDAHFYPLDYKDTDDFSDRNIKITVDITDTIVNKKKTYHFSEKYYHGDLDSFSKAIAAVVTDMVANLTVDAKRDKNIAYM